MKEPEARKNHYRCPKCHTPLEESRGDYYCPVCILAESKPGTWAIDQSTGRKILTYDQCSVIEGEQADFLMRLIAESA